MPHDTTPPPTPPPSTNQTQSDIRPASTPSSQPTGLRLVSIIFRIAVIFGIFAFAAGIVAMLMVTREQPALNNETVSSIRVRTITATKQPVHRTWDGYGTSRSMNDADIVAEVAGRVIERPASIEPGMKVEVGTILLRLDASDYTNALNAANQAANAIEAQINGLSVESERIGTQIQLANDEISAAQSDLERTRQAVQAGAGSAGEIDVKTAALRRVQREVETLKERFELIPSRRAQLLAQLASQRANAANAQDNLNRSTIRSPIAGVIQSVEARRGDWLALGSPVARVLDLSRIEIPLRLPASSSRWIGLGDTVQLWEGDPTNQPDQTGIITRIAPEADASNRTITIYVEVEQDPDAPNRLNPGRFVIGRVHSLDEHPRFVVPRRAVQSSRVMIATLQDDGTHRIQVRPITVAYSIEGRIDTLDPVEDQWAVIGSGLQGGEHIAISLLDQIHEGLIIKVIEQEPASESQQHKSKPAGITP